MNPLDFINQYNGKAWDFDGYYGIQCVDLAQYYAKWLGYPKFTGNAIDIWNQAGTNYERIFNTPSYVPKAGDIIIWNTQFGNGYGHVAIANGNGTTDWFESLDQNWGSSAAHIVRHNYTGVLGCLRPKKLIVVPPQPVVSYKTVRSDVPVLQVRTGPATWYAGNQANTPDGVLHAGMTASCVAIVDGQSVTVAGVTSNKWCKSIRGNYYALAGVK